jgi:hypothetical protein
MEPVIEEGQLKRRLDLGRHALPILICGIELEAD